jgi:GNAT superfamily N-acetyltransferase
LAVIKLASLRASAVKLNLKTDGLRYIRVSMNVDIRFATMQDVPAVQALLRESVSVMGARYYTSKQIASALSHVFGVDTQLILDETYFIAEIEGQTVGSGGWSRRNTLFGGDQAKTGKGVAASTKSLDSAPDALLDPATDAARIRAFYVHPQWSRKGVGSLILTSCEEAARSAGFHQVELAATLPGVPFYLDRGYEKAEEILIEMPDGESLPTFRMTRTL